MWVGGSVYNRGQSRYRTVRMAKKSRLNSIDRFRKDPGRLVLEQHSHCEVPAGCGGVVLRWRNPLVSRLFRVHVYTPWEIDWRIDGREVTNTLVDLAIGPHVMSLHIDQGEVNRFCLMFAAVPGRYSQAGPAEAPVRILSAADGTWRYTLTEPAGIGWMAPGYDDSGWSDLRAGRTARLEWKDFGSYAHHHCREAGAACLAIPRPPRKAGSLWVRKAFTVPAPDLAGGPA